MRPVALCVRGYRLLGTCRTRRCYCVQFFAVRAFVTLKRPAALLMLGNGATRIVTF